MGDDTKATVAEADIAESYSWALEHAQIQAGGRGSEYHDMLIDAATSGVLWAINHYDPATGRFAPFAAQSVRVCVARAKMLHFEKSKVRPKVGELPDQVTATPRQSAAGRSLLIDDLPPDLAFVVRLYMVDGYDLRDCGMLLGVGPNVIQRKLKEAAQLLAPGRTVPVRKANARRLGRQSEDELEA